MVQGLCPWYGSQTAPEKPPSLLTCICAVSVLAPTASRTLVVFVNTAPPLMLRPKSVGTVVSSAIGADSVPETLPAGSRTRAYTLLGPSPAVMTQAVLAAYGCQSVHATPSFERLMLSAGALSVASDADTLSVTVRLGAVSAPPLTARADRIG